MGRMVPPGTPPYAAYLCKRITSGYWLRGTAHPTSNKATSPKGLYAKRHTGMPAYVAVHHMPGPHGYAVMDTATGWHLRRGMTISRAYAMAARWCAGDVGGPTEYE